VNDENTQKYLKKTMMSPETFERFVSQSKSFPQKIKVLRIIGNGEPTLNGHIAEYVKQAKDSGAFEKIEITTNGTLLNPKLSDKLIAAGLDTIKISLEATDTDKFREIAGVDVDVGSLYGNIEYFYHHRCDCKVYIKTTNIALDSAQKKENFMEYWGRICDYIFVENVSEIWPEYSPASNVQRYGDNTPKHVENPICIQPFELLAITADGEVMPCCADWKRTLTLGNINDVPLIEIWRSESIRRLQMSLLSKDDVMPCRNCGFPAASQRDYIDSEANAILLRLKNEEDLRC
jgi:radical SAM protein with 4Fe4S-binding SPASM domain